MKFVAFKIYVAVFILLHAVGRINGVCLDNFMQQQQQQQCQDNAFRTLQPYGMRQCVNLCKNTPTCISINYIRTTLTCELKAICKVWNYLNSAFFNSSVTLTTYDDCINIEMENIATNNIQNGQQCHFGACKIFEMCVEMSRGPPYCLEMDQRSLFDVETGSSSVYVDDGESSFNLNTSAGEENALADLNSAWVAYSSKYAIDDDLTTMFHSGTEYYTFPYWWMTFQPVMISKIVVRKRKSFFYRFRDVTAWIGSNVDNLHICDTFVGPDDNDVTEFNCNGSFWSNTVKLEHRGPVGPNYSDYSNHDAFRILTLTEVYIYG